MYSTLLIIHSLIRWLILAGFIYAIGRAYYGWFTRQAFNKLDNKTLVITASLAHLQLVVGIWLYFISPIVDFFLHNFKEAVHIKEFRFFGMEHGFIMIIAITLITIGSSIAKRKKADLDKFKTIAIWYSLGLVIMLAGLPLR